MDTIAPAQVPETRLIQFREDGRFAWHSSKMRKQFRSLAAQGGTYALAQQSIQEGRSLRSVVESLTGKETVSYQGLIDAGAILPPIRHPDPAHCCVSGTGLTHLGSADTRDSMHVKLNDPTGALTDSMKMFKLGLEGGKPELGKNWRPAGMVLQRGRQLYRSTLCADSSSSVCFGWR